MKDSVIYKSKDKAKTQKIFDYMTSSMDKNILREHRIKIGKLEDEFNKKQRQLFEKSFSKYVAEYPEMFIC